MIRTADEIRKEVDAMGLALNAVTSNTYLAHRALDDMLSTFVNSHHIYMLYIANLSDIELILYRQAIKDILEEEQERNEQIQKS